MEHPPPLPTTSLEDLPPPYLDYLDAAALCRLGYGTTKKQHYGVTSAAVRCAIDRDAVPLGAGRPRGAAKRGAPADADLGEPLGLSAEGR